MATATIQRLATYLQALGADATVTAASGSTGSARYFSVLTYGAVGDGKYGTDAQVFSGSNVCVSASAPWSASDQGKPIVIAQKVTVTAASNAAPIVITSNGHGLVNGTAVQVRGVIGNTTANGPFVVANAAANTFELSGSSGNGAYTGGGTVTAPLVTTIAGVASAGQLTLATTATATATGCSFLCGTDDTVAFQAAADAAGLVNGTTYVPSAPVGTRYLIRHAPYVSGNSPAALRLHPNTRLTGDGLGTIIQHLPPTSGVVWDMVSSTNSFYQGYGGTTGAYPSAVDTNISVDNVTLDGSREFVVITGAGGGGTEHVVYMTRVSGCVFRDMAAVNGAADGIVLEYSKNCTIQNIYSTNNGKVGVYFPGSANCSYTDSVSYRDGGAVLAATARNIVIADNAVSEWAYNMPGSVLAGIGLAGDVRHSTVSGNTVSNGSGTSVGAIWLFNRAVGATPTPGHGLTYGAGTDAAGSYPYGASFNAVTGNTVNGNTCIGIYLNDYCDHNVVTGNTVTGNSQTGIELQAAQYNTVESNKIYNNGTTGVWIVASAATRTASHNRIANNEIADVVVQELVTLTGTVDTTATSAAVAGTGTKFLTEIGNGAIAALTPILIAGETVYHYVASVASDTALTLTENAALSLTGKAIYGPKLTAQITHPSATQTAAILEQNISATGADLNWIGPNHTTGTITLAGATTKIYAQRGGTSGRISATGDVTIDQLLASIIDIPGATTGVFTALHTGNMIVDGAFYYNLASGGGLGNFFVGALRVSVNGGAFATQLPTLATNNEGSRTNTFQTWVVPVTAGSTYTVKLAAYMTPAVTSTYLVFGNGAQTGFTYRFV